jgi:hypothetical protein
MNLVKASLPLMIAVSLGLGACNGARGPDTSAALQAAGSKAGSTNDPAATGVCKESTDSNGAPCKICVDGSGNISYDGCSLGGTGGAGGSSGTGGVGSGGELKCIPTTDASTGATCKTCYAADGSFTSYCPPPPPQGCVDASGKNLCGTGGVGSGGSGGDLKCIPTTDASRGESCKT